MILLEILGVYMVVLAAYLAFRGLVAAQEVIPGVNEPGRACEPEEEPRG